MEIWWLLFAVGFVAQLVDGALGMAYGLLTNAALLAIGLPPAHASALVHTAEVFTTSASAASHIYHRNVDWRMVARLGLAGVLGAILGAWVLSNIEVTAARRFVYAYLLIMGLYILWKSRRIAPDRAGTTNSRKLDCSARIWRRVSRCDWRWRVGTDDNNNARGVRARAALLRRLGQYSRVLRDRLGGNHFFHGNWCRTLGTPHSTCAWRRARGSIRRLVCEACPSSGLDDGRRRADRDALSSAAFPRAPVHLVRFSSGGVADIIRTGGYVRFWKFSYLPRCPTRVRNAQQRGHASTLLIYQFTPVLTCLRRAGGSPAGRRGACGPRNRAGLEAACCRKNRNPQAPGC